MNYSYDQQRQYIFMSRRVGNHWLEVFSGNTEFYSSHYWDLLTEMWFIDKPVMVSDALKYMKSIKSPFTARKYLQKVIDEKIVIEKKNPQDERSMLVELSAEMRKKLDRFFDNAMGELHKTVDDIKSKR